jgi:hypothetical protein
MMRKNMLLASRGNVLTPQCARKTPVREQHIPTIVIQNNPLLENTTLGEPRVKAGC